MSGTAIIAGRGRLPAVLRAAVPDAVVASMSGFIPEDVVPDIEFRLERLVPLLRDLSSRNVSRIIFAGAVKRPDLDPSLFDPETAAQVPRILAAMQGGDDGLLRAVIALFEETGFDVIGAQEIAPDLVPVEGIICGDVTEQHRADATRAASIVAALGSVDVGQGAVVSRGLCLAMEALPGTDAMLDWVCATRTGTGGVFYKAPKPQQDKRIDLPTLGLDTLRRAEAAKIDCIAWEAGGVLLLDRDDVVAEAERCGITLWARGI
ncbi:LpxI family protein [Falsirhodobacter sp. alg1]|uniref:LpxI family protein n=1 Tax=Falsirhodobacter sp. alg1 TaxID=1472418 RepID=UPI000787CBF7|nr:UDP-2,3-diacylglucosamine diphosphatase LpxI [Falsirhodobacter sp. alg1]